MQFISPSRQLTAILWAVIFGAACAAVYDGVRFLRRLFLPEKENAVSTVFVNILDVIYSAALGAGFSVFLFAVNSGRFRWFLLLGAAAGFSLYRLSAGRIVNAVTEKIAAVVKRTAGFILRVLMIPLKAVLKILKTAVLGIKRRRDDKKTEKEKMRRSKSVSSGRGT